MTIGEIIEHFDAMAGNARDLLAEVPRVPQTVEMAAYNEGRADAFEFAAKIMRAWLEGKS